MPKTTVRAAAEGMPSINRRHAILGAGATMAALAALTRPAPAGASPLLDRSHRSWEPNSANLSIRRSGEKRTDSRLIAGGQGI
jgi:hypothetical protein